MQAIALQDMVSQTAECSTIYGNSTALLKTAHPINQGGLSI